MKLIYCKASNYRRRIYQIYTRIYQSDKGKWVEKESIYPEGKTHIRHIYQNMETLKKLYGDTYEAVSCKMQGDVICFPYINGNTLEEKIIAAISKDYTLKTLKEQFDIWIKIIVGNVNNITEFKMTQEFKEIFGDAEELVGCKALKVCNFDCNCDNIIMGGEIPAIFDYEWVYEFPIPLDLILYRLILDFYSRSHVLRKYFQFEQILDICGIHSTLDVIRRLCMNFYRHIMIEKDTQINMGTIGRSHIDSPIIPISYDSLFYATVYFDTGKGFSEKEKTVFSFSQTEKLVNWNCVPPQGCRLLRLDPVEQFCCAVHELKIISGESILKHSALNGISIGEYLFFDNTDPQILIALPENYNGQLNIIATILPFTDPDYLLFAQETKPNIMQIGDELSVSRQGLKAKIEELTHLKKELSISEQRLEDMVEDLSCKETELFAAKQELQTCREQYNIALDRCRELEHRAVTAESAYAVISNAFFWKAIKPVRCFADALKRITILNLSYKGIQCLKENGYKYTSRKIKEKILTLKDNSFSAKEKACFVLPQLTSYERERQTRTSFQRNIKFSIVVPMYNTPIDFLTELLDSVEDQTYSNWELCLADGGSYNRNIAKIIEDRVGKDKRIKYSHLRENKGIAGNTQAAFELAIGDYIVLMDHDDLLTEDALFETAKCIELEPDADFIYSDRGIFEDFTKRLLAFHYLPAYSPDFLRACNYASHMNVFSRRIINEVGFMRYGYDGSQDYDLELRTIEKARKIVNIEKVLYYCRACEGSVALNPESKMYAYEAGRKAIEEHISRIGYPGKVDFLPATFSYRIHYDIIRSGKTTIIIPNKDHSEALKTCINSILARPCQDPYEIVIVENGSAEPETFMYYQSLKENPKVRLLVYECNGGEFNYSALNNFAVDHTDGRYILFLNNDTEVISDNWLTEMLMFAQREDVGAVGAKLYYPNDTYQHVGLFLGLGGHIASHYDHGKSRYESGYMHRLSMPQNYNALTAACLMIKREDFLSVEGFDEACFKVGLNDVDLCLKLRELGKVNVLTPYAELYHYESLSRGSDKSGVNGARLEKEQEMFRRKWKKYYDRHDIYYNPGIYK